MTITAKQPKTSKERDLGGREGGREGGRKRGGVGKCEGGRSERGGEGRWERGRGCTL